MLDAIALFGIFRRMATRMSVSPSASTYSWQQAAAAAMEIDHLRRIDLTDQSVAKSSRQYQDRSDALSERMSFHHAVTKNLHLNLGMDNVNEPRGAFLLRSSSFQYFLICASLIARAFLSSSV